MEWRWLRKQKLLLSERLLAGYPHALIESDSKASVDAIHSKNFDAIEFGHVISSCRSFLRNENSFKVVFARRQANRVAHTLVLATIHHACFNTFFVAPRFIGPLLLDDCHHATY